MNKLTKQQKIILIYSVVFILVIIFAIIYKTLNKKDNSLYDPISETNYDNTVTNGVNSLYPRVLGLNNFDNVYNLSNQTKSKIESLLIAFCKKEYKDNCKDVKIENKSIKLDQKSTDSSIAFNVYFDDNNYKQFIFITSPTNVYNDELLLHDNNQNINLKNEFLKSDFKEFEQFNLSDSQFNMIVKVIKDNANHKPGDKITISNIKDSSDNEIKKYQFDVAFKDSKYQMFINYKVNDSLILIDLNNPDGNLIYANHTFSNY